MFSLSHGAAILIWETSRKVNKLCNEVFLLFRNLCLHVISAVLPCPVQVGLICVVVFCFFSFIR